MNLTKREKKITGEFGYLYQEMYRKMKEKLESKTTEELNDIFKAFSKLTKTNCGWTSYKMKDVVLWNVLCILDNENANTELIP